MHIVTIDGEPIEFFCPYGIENYINKIGPEGDTTTMGFGSNKSDKLKIGRKIETYGGKSSCLKNYNDKVIRGGKIIYTETTNLNNGPKFENKIVGGISENYSTSGSSPKNIQNAGYHTPDILFENHETNPYQPMFSGGGYNYMGF